MSLASFNLFLGGAFGAFVHGMIIKLYGTEIIFQHTATIILAIGIFAAIFISRYEMRKKQRAYS